MRLVTTDANVSIAAEVKRNMVILRVTIVFGRYPRFETRSNQGLFVAIRRLRNHAGFRRTIEPGSPAYGMTLRWPAQNMQVFPGIRGITKQEFVNERKLEITLRKGAYIWLDSHYGRAQFEKQQLTMRLSATPGDWPQQGCSVDGAHGSNNGFKAFVRRGED